MKRTRCSVDQIVIRHLGIAEQTFYRWKRRYAGLESEQVREFNQLQEEHAKLNRLVADVSLDNVMLQDVLAKQWEGPRSGAPLRRTWARRIRSVTGEPAGPSAARGPHSSIRASAIHAPSFGSESGRWPRRGSATATARFGCS